MSSGLAEMGHGIFRDPSSVLPRLTHVMRYSQHAKVRLTSVGAVAGFAWHKQAPIGELKQAAPANAGVIGGMPPYGTRHGREAFGCTPGMSVVARSDPEGNPRPRNPTRAVIFPIFISRDKFCARSVHVDATVREGVDAAIHNPTQGIG